MSPWLSACFLQTQSDARLIALSRAGHERAFEALVHRYRKPLLAYCHQMRVPAAKAEDAVQQGLLQAWVALQDGADVRQARPWLYRIVRNAALRTIERPGVGDAELSESLVGADAPQFELDRRITVRETLAGVAALPMLQREALVRTAVNGHSHEHVAVALGLSENAVRGLVYRARTTLRNAATAFTPFPLVEWGARGGRKGNQLAECLAGLGAGGGAAGVGAVVKGTAAVMASVLLVGAVVVHPRRDDSEHRADAAVSAQRVMSELPTNAHQVRFVVGSRAVGALPTSTVAASRRRSDATGGSGPGTSHGSGRDSRTIRNDSGGHGSGTTPRPSVGGSSGPTPSSGAGGSRGTTSSSGTGSTSATTASPNTGSRTGTAPPSNTATTTSGATRSSSTGNDDSETTPSSGTGTTPSSSAAGGSGTTISSTTSDDESGTAPKPGTVTTPAPSTGVIPASGAGGGSPPAPTAVTDDAISTGDAGSAPVGSTSGD